MTAFPTRPRADRREAGSGLLAVFFLLFASALLGDVAVAEWAARAGPWVKSLGRWVSVFGLSGYMLVPSGLVVVLGGLALARGWTSWAGLPLRAAVERSAYFFATIALSGIVAQVVKHCIGRARPKLMPEFGAFHCDPLSLHGSLASFPSGHTVTVLAGAYVFGRFARRCQPLFYGLACLVALARVLAGEHYPSDVVAGAALGLWMARGLALVFARRNLTFRPGRSDMGPAAFDGPMAATGRIV